jgi:ADP-ribosyl-[dinitrogen reductase] hydrolase
MLPISEALFVQTAKTLFTGFVVGDCMGVPHEFKTAQSLIHESFEEMTGGGVHDQLAGTWSDDTALAMCTFEVLKTGTWPIVLGDIFSEFLIHGHWTVDKHVFDIGIATRRGIEAHLDEPEIWTSETPLNPRFPNRFHDNGNGALMRMPSAILLAMATDLHSYHTLAQACSHPTHNHTVNATCCEFYIRLGVLIASGLGLEDSMSQAYSQTKNIAVTIGIDRPLHSVEAIRAKSTEALNPKGFVLDSLEIALWSVLQARNYKEAIQHTLRLGHDTDTNAAITGSLAALVFGLEDIPISWINGVRSYDRLINNVEAYAKEMYQLPRDGFIPSGL